MPHKFFKHEGLDLNKTIGRLTDLKTVNKLKLCVPLVAVMRLGLCPTFDIITFDHLYSTCAGGKGLSNDTQIRVIGSMEPEICTKMLGNLSEKL